MKKLLNKKGFTLMEMLIVVAIIVILVAISIPAFSSALDEAKVAADKANFRSAKAAAVLATTIGTAPADGAIYDINKGEFVAVSDTAKKANVGQCSKHKSAYIVFVAADGSVKWSDGTATPIDECN